MGKLLSAKKITFPFGNIAPGASSQPNPVGMFGPCAQVFVEGEYWNAVSEVPIEAGHPVEIVAVNGLTLKVKPKQPPTT